MTDLSAFEKPVNGPRSSIEVGPDGGEFQTGEMRAPIQFAKDWDSVLEGFGLDPTIFYVVDDTVKMSKWQTSKRTDDGDRDVVWLYSYKARFALRAPQIEEVDLDVLRGKISKWKPPKSFSPKSLTGEECTFVVTMADWQIGKAGVAETVERLRVSLEGVLARVKELRKAGRNITAVALLNMGDPSEGCDGNYASQRFSVELTQRGQLNLVMDLWTQWVAALQPDVFASVLCNHGEWTRNGGSKPVTTDSDNVGGYLGDTLKRVFEGRVDAPSGWHIAHDEMVQVINLSGVEVAITHGHKITGKEFEWLQGQGQRVQYETGRMPRVWVTAHRHHVAVEDFGPFWRLQCPSQDGGSKWYSDSTGKWASPGTMTFLVGEHDARGWSDLAIC